MNSRRVVGFVEKIYQLLMINICFFITTLPLMAALILLKPTLMALPFYLIASVSLGPTLFATSDCVSRLTEEQTVEVFKTFFESWRKQFKTSLGMTYLLEMVVIIGIVDMIYFSQSDYLQWFNPIIVLIMVVVLMIYGNWLIVYPRSLKNTKEIIKEATYYAFSKWLLSLVNALLLGILFLTMIIKPVFGFLVFPSLIVILMLWNTRKLVENT